MTVFDLAKARGVRQQTAPSSIANLAYEQQRTRPRAVPGAIGTLLALMGVAMGVLTIRFILVFVHTALQ
jgi:predicted lipid-binding transport protein (Tim44 family)